MSSGADLGVRARLLVGGLWLKGKKQRTVFNGFLGSVWKGVPWIFVLIFFLKGVPWIFGLQFFCRVS